jgi:hypothetical protein
MTKPFPAPNDEDREAALDAAIAFHGLAVDPAWRAAILGHMKVTGGAARLVLEFPLGDERDPAPVFRP